MNAQPEQLAAAHIAWQQEAVEKVAAYRRWVKQEAAAHRAYNDAPEASGAREAWKEVLRQMPELPTKAEYVIADKLG